MFKIVGIKDDAKGDIKVSEGALSYAIGNKNYLQVAYDNFVTDSTEQSIAESRGGNVKELTDNTEVLVHFREAGFRSGNTIAFNVNKISLEADGKNTKVYVRNISDEPKCFVVDATIDKVEEAIMRKNGNG